jgi:hypothetical protein
MFAFGLPAKLSPKAWEDTFDPPDPLPSPDFIENMSEKSNDTRYDMIWHDMT